MSTHDQDMPILSGYIARRAADDARILAFGTRPWARGQTVAPQQIGPRLLHRYSAISAPGVLANTIAQRFVVGEQAGSGAELPLSVPARRPAAARWAGPRWPTGSASGVGEAVPDPGFADEPLLNDLAGLGWGGPKREPAQPLQAPAMRSAQPARRARPVEPALHSDVLDRASAIDQAPDAGMEEAPAPPAERIVQPSAGMEEELSGSDAGSSTDAPVVTRDPSDSVVPPAALPGVPGSPAPTLPDVPAAPVVSRGAGVVNRSPATPHGNLAAVDLALVRPAGLRPTALMRKGAPNPLARMGFMPASLQGPAGASLASDSGVSSVVPAERPLAAPSAPVAAAGRGAPAQRRPGASASGQPAALRRAADQPASASVPSSQVATADTQAIPHERLDVLPGRSVDADPLAIQRESIDLPLSRPVAAGMPADRSAGGPAADAIHAPAAEPPDPGSQADLPLDGPIDANLVQNEDSSQPASEPSGSFAAPPPAPPVMSPSTPGQGALVLRASAPRMTPLHFSELLMRRASIVPGESSGSAPAIAQRSRAIVLPGGTGHGARLVGSSPADSGVAGGELGLAGPATSPVGPARAGSWVARSIPGPAGLDRSVARIAGTPAPIWTGLGAAQLPLSTPALLAGPAQYADAQAGSLARMVDAPLETATGGLGHLQRAFDMPPAWPGTAMFDYATEQHWPAPAGFEQQGPQSFGGPAFARAELPAPGPSGVQLVARAAHRPVGQAPATQIPERPSPGWYADAAGPELPLASPAALVARQAVEQIQRLAEPDPAGSTASNASASSSLAASPARPAAQNDPQQIEQMANQVYEHLRRRLLIERERRGPIM